MAEGDDEAGGGATMSGVPPRGVWKQLDDLFRLGVSGHVGDAELLGRFVAARRGEDAEDAFAALVERHGPMVLGVCRRVLRDRHDAEDAFQATFLVLARKAGAIANRERLSSWLHGVASRTALDARSRADRRRAHEARAGATAVLELSPDDAPEHAEVRGILDEELSRLPDSYRGPVILCEMDGLSRRDAAERLGIPEGTLSSRLARAKDLLRNRLARRGLAPSTVAIEALAREARAVLLPPSLAISTIRAATRVAAGAPLAEAVAASVVTLTQGALNVMLFAKIKGLALGMAAAAAVTTGVAVMGQVPPPPPSRDSAPSDERLGAVEKKLDRILEALGGRRADATENDEPRYSSYRPAPGGSAGFIETPVPGRAGMTIVADGSGPIEARLGNLERRLSDLEHRFAAMEGRLNRIAPAEIRSDAAPRSGASTYSADVFRGAPPTAPGPDVAPRAEGRPAPKP